MLQAKIDGKWGAVPESILPQLPDPGSLLSFEFLYNFMAPDKDKINRKRWRNHEQLTNPIAIRNPKKGEPAILIGLINGVDLMSNPLPDGIRRLTFHPNAGGGLTNIVIGDSIEGDELAQFLLLTTESETSKFRNEGVAPIIRLKDFVAEAKQRSKQRLIEREAYGIAIGLKGAALKETALLLGYPANRDEGLIMDDVEDYARKFPETFIALQSDPSRKAKAVLAAGLANGAFVLNEDVQAITYAENNGVILKLTGGTDRENVMKEFADYIDGAKDGKRILQGLEVMVDKKDKPAKA